MDNDNHNNPLGLQCHTCKEHFKDNDLIVPLNINVFMPSGRFMLTIYQHYLCGLGYYLDNLHKIDITDKDRMEIQTKLVEVIDSINQGRVQ